MKFEYKVKCRHKLGWKEIKLYADTNIEEFFNRNGIEYIRNITDTIEHRQLKEIERLNKRNKEIYEGFMATTKELTEYAEENERLKDLCEKYEEEHRTTFEEWKKTVNIINEFDKFLFEELQTYGGGGTAQEYYDKLQELKGSDK